MIVFRRKDTNILPETSWKEYSGSSSLLFDGTKQPPIAFTIPTAKERRLMFAGGQLAVLAALSAIDLVENSDELTSCDNRWFFLFLCITDLTLSWNE